MKKTTEIKNELTEEEKKAAEEIEKEQVKRFFLRKIEKSISDYEKAVEEHIADLQKGPVRAFHVIGYWGSTPNLVELGLSFERAKWLQETIKENPEKKIHEILKYRVDDETRQQMSFTGNLSTSAWSNAYEITKATERRFWLGNIDTHLRELQKFDI